MLQKTTASFIFSDYFNIGRVYYIQVKTNGLTVIFKPHFPNFLFPYSICVDLSSSGAALRCRIFFAFFAVAAASKLYP